MYDVAWPERAESLLTVAAGSAGDQTTERILDASLAQMLDFGLRRFSVEDVARRAGINRITVYRRFSGKDQLIGAVIAREGMRLFTTLDAAITGLESPAEQIVEGFVTALSTARRHPLVKRTMEVEPEMVASLLLTHGAVMVSLATDYLTLYARQTWRGPEDPAVVAELAVRLSLSLLLIPEGRIPTATDEELRRFATQYIVPAVAEWSPRPGAAGPAPGTKKRPRRLS